MNARKARRRGPVVLHRNVDRVLERLRQRCKRYGQNEVARRAGVPSAYVCDAMKGRRIPAGQLLAWLGFELAYIPKLREKAAEDEITQAMEQIAAAPIARISDILDPAKVEAELNRTQNGDSAPPV